MYVNSAIKEKIVQCQILAPKICNQVLPVVVMGNVLRRQNLTGVAIASVILAGMANSAKDVDTASVLSRMTESFVAVKIVEPVLTRPSWKKTAFHPHAANASMDTLAMTVRVMHRAQETTVTRKDTVRQESANAFLAGLAIHAIRRLHALSMVRSNVPDTENAF